MKTQIIKNLAFAAFLAAAAFSASAQAQTVKVGVVGENNEQWKPIIEKLKQEGTEL